jgi:hypothetical protein
MAVMRQLDWCPHGVGTSKPVNGEDDLADLLLVIFPASTLKGVESVQMLAVIVVPETIFVVAAVALWRKRRPMAVGLVLSAVTLVAHVVVHLTTH